MMRRSIYLTTVALVVTGLTTATTALAAGVSAGAVIENTATATYRSGADSRTVESNTVSVLVDELLDVTVVTNDSTPLPLGNSNTALSFTITNVGNGSEAFDLTVDPTVTGSDFDANVVGIAFDTNGNGTYDEGIDDLLPGSNRQTALIAADAAEKVFVIVSVPGGVAEGSSGIVRLEARASTGSGSAGTVFAGAGTNGGDGVVGATGALASADGGLVAALATVTLVKSVSIVDPFAGNQAVPGAIVTYSIVASVAGSGSVVDLAISDAIPTGTTYRPGTLRLDGAVLTDGSDTDTGQASGAGVSVIIGALSGGASRTVSFEALIQ